MRVMRNIIPLAREGHLASYLRPGRLGSAKLRDVIAQGAQPCDGVVLDPIIRQRQLDLAAVARAAGIETILEPHSLELASAGGMERAGLKELPWASDQIQTPATLGNLREAKRVISSLAEYAVEFEYSAVLAPTHFIDSPAHPWLDVDDQLVSELRAQLDQLGAARVLVYRPLYLHANLLRDTTEIARITSRLLTSPIDGIWLAVHPFGSTSSGPLALRRYVDASRQLHRTRVPLVGLHTGTVGLLLMALGCLSGIESGMTDLESFHVDRLITAPRPKDGGTPMGATPRIFVQSLGVFLTTKEARAFFGVRGMTSQHVCQAGCCPRGFEDTVRDRLRHFAISRSKEVSRLARTPAHLRTQVYLDEFLRPASDRAVAASKAHPRVAAARKRLDDWRQTYRGIVDNERGQTPSIAPDAAGRRIPPSERVGG
jgi:hypothetical protein